MARSSNHNDIEDNGEDEENEEDYIEYLNKKGKVVFDALHNNKNVLPNLFEIMSYAIESTKLIEMKEENIDKIFSLEREYANDIHDLKYALEEEQEIRVSLEEKLESIEESYNEIISKLTKEHELDLAKLSSPIDNDNDACATNSTSCKASILKENVELRAQLELLISKYGKLEESYEKLSSSNEDVLVSHARLKLAQEAISTKVTSCEPHVDICTNSQNVILPCASPSNSSTHNIATSSDELLFLPCCSNNEASTSTSTCVVTNHVEEIKELKAQVTSLKKDLENCHEGKSTLNKILSVQKSPNDKSGLGFKSINKNKSKINKKKKGQEQVKNLAKIVCFKCKIEGNHVRSCPLKKKPLSEKQQGKQPQVQGHAQPHVEERSLPKKN
jgi:septal ring factor EnvC (AmiA/AmiB activator)